MGLNYERVGVSFETLMREIVQHTSLNFKDGDRLTDFIEHQIDDLAGVIGKENTFNNVSQKDDYFIDYFAMLRCGNSYKVIYYTTIIYE